MINSMKKEFNKKRIRTTKWSDLIVVFIGAPILVGSCIFLDGLLFVGNDSFFGVMKNKKRELADVTLQYNEDGQIIGRDYSFEFEGKTYQCHRDSTYAGDEKEYVYFDKSNPKNCSNSNPIYEGPINAFSVIPLLVGATVMLFLFTICHFFAAFTFCLCIYIFLVRVFKI